MSLQYVRGHIDAAQFGGTAIEEIEPHPARGHRILRGNANISNLPVPISCNPSFMMTVSMLFLPCDLGRVGPLTAEKNNQPSEGEEHDDIINNNNKQQSNNK